MVRKVFQRNVYYTEQFQIGNLRKEFTKPELLIADSLWRAYTHDQRVELKQAIIAALKVMREHRALIAQEKHQVNQYAQELINNTCMISYLEVSKELQTPIYRRLRFKVTLSVLTIESTECVENIQINTRAAALMTQLVGEEIERIQLSEGTSHYIPKLILTGSPRHLFREEQKKTLLSTGFVRFIEINEEKNLAILTLEIVRVLKTFCKNYPYTLQIFVLSQGTYSLVRILIELPLLTRISSEDLPIKEAFSQYEISKQWAYNIEHISYQLGEKGEEWYTLYILNTTVIQAMEVSGPGTVEQRNKYRAPMLVELPSSLPEVTALGMANPKVLEEAQ